MSTAKIRTLSEHASFGGVQGFYEHDSGVVGLPMRFGVYRPPQATGGPVPVLLCLAGLTCNEETFALKAGAQRHAAEHGLMLVTPDTSPRRTGLPGATDDWDFGEGAGFYLDATQGPWAGRFRMESWLVQELLPLLRAHFPSQRDRLGVCGHSMGGHGALTLALRHPGRFRSVSAFAPICAPSEVPWGHKAFSRYLGDDRAAWAEWDACALIARRTFPGTLLVDQGTDDKFLVEQLKPERLREVCAATGQALELRMRDGYDHSYWTIASFIEEHLHHHARALRG